MKKRPKRLNDLIDYLKRKREMLRILQMTFNWKMVEDGTKYVNASDKSV